MNAVIQSAQPGAKPEVSLEIFRYGSCPVCGGPLKSSRQQACSAACKQKAYRTRNDSEEFREKENNRKKVHNPYDHELTPEWDKCREDCPACDWDAKHPKPPQIIRLSRAAVIKNIAESIPLPQPLSEEERKLVKVKRGKPAAGPLTTPTHFKLRQGTKRVVRIEGKASRRGHKSARVISQTPHARPVQPTKSRRVRNIPSHHSYGFLQADKLSKEDMKKFSKAFKHRVTQISLEAAREKFEDLLWRVMLHRTRGLRELAEAEAVKRQFDWKYQLEVKDRRC